VAEDLHTGPRGHGRWEWGVGGGHTQYDDGQASDSQMIPYGGWWLSRREGHSDGESAVNVFRKPMQRGPSPKPFLMPCCPFTDPFLPDMAQVRPALHRST
jgi:hypothetical protein